MVMTSEETHKKEGKIPGLLTIGLDSTADSFKKTCAQRDQ